MKKIIVIAGLFLLLLNIAAALVFDNYNPINFLLVSVSILTTLAFIYFASSAKNLLPYKIGLILLYSITGLIKVGVSFFSSSVFQNNATILILLSILIAESILLMIVQYMRKHA